MSEWISTEERLPKVGQKVMTKEEILKMGKNELLKAFLVLTENYFAYCYNCKNCDHCYYCYNCDHCDNCNHCYYCYNCDQCDNCNHCDNCYNCEYCYLCTGQTGKRYMILNVQFTKEEYEQKLKEIVENKGD